MGKLNAKLSGKIKKNDKLINFIGSKAYKVIENKNKEKIVKLENEADILENKKDILENKKEINYDEFQLDKLSGQLNQENLKEYQETDKKLAEKIEITDKKLKQTERDIGNQPIIVQQTVRAPLEIIKEEQNENVFSLETEGYITIFPSEIPKTFKSKDIEDFRPINDETNSKFVKKFYGDKRSSFEKQLLNKEFINNGVLTDGNEYHTGYIVQGEKQLKLDPKKKYIIIDETKTLIKLKEFGNENAKEIKRSRTKVDNELYIVDYIPPIEKVKKSKFLPEKQSKKPTKQVLTIIENTKKEKINLEKRLSKLNDLLKKRFDKAYKLEKINLKKGQQFDREKLNKAIELRDKTLKDVEKIQKKIHKNPYSNAKGFGTKNTLNPEQIEKRSKSFENCVIEKKKKSICLPKD